MISVSIDGGWSDESSLKTEQNSFQQNSFYLMFLLSAHSPDMRIYLTVDENTVLSEMQESMAVSVDFYKPTNMFTTLI